MHLGTSPDLLATCYECLQFNVKTGHISNFHAIMGTSYNLILFVYTFYAFEYPLFYSHHNRDGDIMVIPSTMGTH
jgi:hypothetical protein